MRRLTETDRDDSGVATIFVVLAMTAMVVGAAFAVDVGGYVAAARSAQNSADATVLAVATDCALRDAPIDDYSPYRKAGQTISAPYCDLSAGETDITVTKEVDGLLLAQSAGDVNRRAWAKWGTLATATTAPVIVADCEFRRALFGNIEDPRDDIIVYLDSPPDGFGCSSTAGGFSLLDAPSSDPCNVEFTAGASASGFQAAGQPGNPLRSKLEPCLTPLPQPILIPIYDSGECELSNCRFQGRGPYLVEGFAMFTVTGYAFGPRRAGSLVAGCPAQAPGMGQLNCIRGDFIKFTTSKGTPGDSQDFGVTQVSLFIK